MAASKTSKSETEPPYIHMNIYESRNGSRVRLTVEVPPQVVSLAYNWMVEQAAELYRQVNPDFYPVRSTL